MPDARITSDLSSAATQLLEDTAVLIEDSTTAIAPTGAEQPASRSASRARSAVTAHACRRVIHLPAHHQPAVAGGIRPSAP